MNAGDGTHEDLFAQAASLPPAQRREFLDRACKGDPALREELESLLEAHDAAAGFLETPALSRGVAGVLAAEDGPLPENVGDYTILGLLGEGGMGTVYLARQEGTSREVALKVMRPGYGGASVRRRFQQEARTLAMLHHPGIAQVYEAGLTGDGPGAQPFFAMELVDGRPLTVHAREAALDARGKLELIAQVCDAVEHAHGRGVIHRDLKPANVLVDRQGRARVLDFGVARATTGDSTAATMHTRPGQLIGTLAYMSPEQVAGDPARVDGRCDVYALGVMLYELLAGRAPFDDQNTPLPEMLRRIREQEAPALGTASGAYRGDIETIVRKALEKDPAQRYASCAAMADDIRRHLRDEPIMARAPSALIQARKFVRRNRMLVGATAAVFAALVLLVVGVSSALVRALEAERLAQEQEQEARAQAARAEAVSQFLQDMLAGVDPSVARGADTTLLRRILDVAAARVEQLKDTPEAEGTARAVIGGSYMFAGLYDEAQGHLERALEIRRAHLGPTHPQTLDSANRLSVLHHRRGNYAQAEQMYRHVLDLRRSAAPMDEPGLYESMSNLAAFYLEMNRIEEAEPLCLEAAEGRRRVLGPENAGTLESLGNLAGMRWQQKRYDEAEHLWTTVSEVRERTLGREHPATISTMYNMALLYSRTGREPEAASLMEEVVDLRRRVLGEEHPDTLVAIMELAQAMVNLGRFDEGEELFTQLLRVQPGILGGAHLRTLALLNNLASLYLSQGRAPEAEDLMTQVVEHARASLPAGNVYLPTYLAARGIARAAQANYSEAEADLLEAHGLLAAIAGGEASAGAEGDAGGVIAQRLVWVAQTLVKVYESWDHDEEAARWRSWLAERQAR